MMAMIILPPAAPKKRVAVAWFATKSPTVAIMNIKPKNAAPMAAMTKKMAIHVSAFMLDGLGISAFYFLHNIFFYEVEDVFP